MNTMNDSMAPENVTYTLFPSSGEVFVSNYQVTSMCLLSKLLFIGTSGGTVAQCVYEECGIYGGLFCYIQLITRTLSNSSITKMQTAASLNLLAILSQNDLFIYDAEKLEPVDFFQTCRGVSTFHLHPKEPECAELCLGFLSRSVQIYKLTRTGTNLSFECKLKVAPSLLCFGEQYLCVATEGQYISLNLHNKEVTELFRYNGARTKPFLAHLQKDEFLISGPGSLAVLVDARGLSQRPPFQLSPNVLELFIWHNYLFAVTDEFFTIHSILNQTQLQTVPLGFATSACFSPLDPHLIFVATTSQGSNKTDLAAIGPERWDHFVRKLILAGCHRQAQHILSREYQLMETLVQERPASSNGVRNIFTMFLETALVKLFVRLSKHGISPALNELIIPSGRLDATIMDLHDQECSTNSPHSTALVDLISSLVHIDVEDLTRYLERCGSHHALALIYQWQGNLPKAVAVWQQLAYGQLSDNDFPGVHFYIAILRW
ncbi:unnamed protein product [Dicrocoelium dendriticum]|nr:unnamed protein product [Dicrocoelium dendriticum]